MDLAKYANTIRRSSDHPTHSDQQTLVDEWEEVSLRGAVKAKSVFV